MKRLILYLLVSMLLASCIPLGKETRSSSTSGTKGTASIERREIDNKFLAVVSPEGFFTRGVNTSIEYWMKKDGKARLLAHISSSRPDKRLKEILGVVGSDQWIAFDLNDVTRESGDIAVIIFDESRIVRTERIPNCKRVDLCAEHFDNMASYSIKPNEDNSVLQIETLTGRRTYDVKKGQFLK